jgi:hypothetical protein
VAPRHVSLSARMIVACGLGTLDPAWHGWALRDGKLISPEGWQVSPGDVLSISLLRDQIRAYQAKERQIEALEEQPLPSAESHAYCALSNVATSPRLLTYVGAEDAT